jgi:hypothetical protein
LTAPYAAVAFEPKRLTNEITAISESETITSCTPVGTPMRMSVMSTGTSIASARDTLPKASTLPRHSK